MYLTNDTLLSLGFHLQSMAARLTHLSITNTTILLASSLSNISSDSENSYYSFRDGTTSLFSPAIARLSTTLGSSPYEVSYAFSKAGVLGSANIPEQNANVKHATTLMAAYYKDGLSHDYMHVVWNTVLIPLPFLVALVVGLRVFARWKLAGGVKLDDWLILGALMLNFVFSAVCLVAGNSYGACQHKWDISWHDAVLNSELTYIASTLYHPVILLVKLSILIFYYRLYPNARFRLVVKIFGVFVVITTLLNTFLIIFQCNPVTDIWLRPTEEKCVPKVFFAYEHCVVNILSDLIILILPIYPVWRLRLKLREKLIVFSLFGLGGIVCIFSVFRLMTVYNFVTSLDLTWVEVYTGLWSALETYVGIFCASVPPVRILIIRLVPGLLGYKKEETAGNKIRKSTKKRFSRRWRSVNHIPSTDPGLTAGSTAVASRMTTTEGAGDVVDAIEPVGDEEKGPGRSDKDRIEEEDEKGLKAPPVTAGSSRSNGSRLRTVNEELV